MGTLYDPVQSILNDFKPEFILSPELWGKFNLDGINVDYSKWSKIKMIASNGELNPDINQIPTEYGGIYVYAIVPPVIPNCGTYVMYIGMATKTEHENLRARVRSYKRQFGSKYNRSKLHSLFNRWGDYIYVYYLPMNSSSSDIKELEDRLIATFGKPPCNKEVLIKTVKAAVDAAF